jgi:integrase
MAFFRKRGKTWEYRISFTDRRTGISKESTKGGYPTKPEAKLAAAKAQIDLDYFGFVGEGNELVERYFTDWLEIYKKPFIKPITYTLQERVVRLNILARWVNYRLKDVTRKEYQQWINQLREHYSEGTVRRIHSIMSTAFNDAVHEYNILRENPLQKIKIPKELNKAKKIQFFTLQELDKLYSTLKKPTKNAKYQLSMQPLALFTLLARTGLRIGEALALTWDDIDIENKKLTVNKTLVYPLNSTPYLSTPKSDKSNRTIMLDDYVIKLMKRHRINQKEVVLKYENYKPTATNIIFHQHDGRWLRTNVVRDLLKEKCKQAGIIVLSPHSLRHTHAVHLLESGANIKYVSERLGHASVKVTADTYLHVTKKIEGDAIALYVSYVGN